MFSKLFAPVALGLFLSFSLQACGTEDSPSQTAKNLAPSITSVEIIGEPVAGSTLIAVPKGWADPEGAPEAYTFAWFANNIEIVGQTGAELTDSHFAKGDAIQVVVTPYDEVQNGTPVASETVVIRNTAPSILSATLAAGPFTAASEIHVQSIAGWQDADGDAEDYHYVWLVNGVPVPGQTASSLRGAFVKNDTVQAAVIPFDGEEAGEPVYTDVVTIGNTPPEVSGVSLGAGPFFTNSILTTNGIATDYDLGDTSTIQYRWFVAGAPVGATGATLDGAIFFSKGQTVAVEMTPFDGDDYGSPVLSAPVTIQNSPPTITTADIGAGPYYTEDTISLVSVSGWADADGDPEDYRYRWYKNGVSLPAQTGNSLSSAHFEKGDHIKLQVTPYDGTPGTPVFSNEVIIQNSAPVVDSVSLGDGPFSKLSTLTAEVSSHDPDNDPLTPQFAWFVDGVLVAGENTETLSGAHFSHGVTVVVNVSVSDPDGLISLTMQSAAVSIGNAAPAAPEVTLYPEQVTAGTSMMYALVATVATDIDGDAVSYAYAWFQNGVEYSTGSTMVTGPFEGGDRWELKAVASDEHGAEGEPTITKTRVLEYAARVAAGDYHTCAVTTTGKLYCWGNNDTGQAGAANTTNVLEPQLVMASGVSDVVAAKGGTCVLTTDNAVKCFGNFYWSSANQRTATPTDVTGLASGVRQISATFEHACAVLYDGTVWCWGSCYYDRCGPNGRFTNHPTPVDVGIANAVTVTTAEQHSCAVTVSGTVVCWGNQYEGRLGNGQSSGGNLPPTEVPGLTGIVSIGSGYGQTCAIKNDGQMYCWGANHGRELGGTSPSHNYQTTPKHMKAQDQSILPPTVFMSGGDRFTVSLRADGTVWGWGSNGFMELGVQKNVADGYAETRYNVKATMLTDIVQMDSGARHTCGVKANGGLVCWGDNYAWNALGNGFSYGDTEGRYSIALTPAGFVP